ncbi:tautomerase family protein [Chryseobacterium sp. W4I1]|uniref:tautomerase family protein n=1 Tax=Chryseobacterium sp. W4I1 TaxID=3042293 RepID=UPI002786D153|nr:tautomerase family protein [Chryseobacterium sp. W4I1]MDQ0782945.1 phenylpyruvate tautomerase PptA (4-oxalocrotonate tautomerase family) [Chryseobacterium sp. W4I1]
MPLVRITLSEKYNQETQDLISKSIHQALIKEFNVPEDDYFHIIESVKPGQLRYPETYLGVKHTEAILFVHITASIGRSVEQKKNLYKSIALNIEKSTQINPQEIIVVLTENVKENWSFGNGELQTFNHI